jgi:hypothetical protein
MVIFLQKNRHILLVKPVEHYIYGPAVYKNDKTTLLGMQANLFLHTTAIHPVLTL